MIPVSECTFDTASIERTPFASKTLLRGVALANANHEGITPAKTINFHGAEKLFRHFTV
jgi:hypothetical protein